VVDFTNLSGSASYTNNGIITVRPSTAADAGLFNAAETDLDGDIHLQGNGELHLADKDTSDDQAVQINANNDSTLLSTTLTNGVDHTIRGTGGIQTNLTNQGLIHADNAGGTLTLINSQGTSPGDERFTLVNSGTIRADTGTTIDVLANGDTGDPFNQVAGAALQHTGTLLADGGDIAIESSVTGTGQGDLIARNGGSIQINGFAEVNNVAFDADASVNVDHELTVAGDLLAGVSGSVTYGNPSTAIINFTGGQGAAIGD